MRVQLDKFLEVVSGRLVKDERPEPDVISGVSTDSRDVKPGDVFFALTGDNFDGHDFVNTAVKAGAQAVVVSLPVEVNGVAVIEVSDPSKALGDVAGWWRRQHKTRVAAVVGSSGKTTTKEMAGEILSRYFNTLTTRGNFNNLVGLPHTLFALQASHEAVVLELGMNVPDENRKLMEIALPNCVVLTNINHAHIGMFDSPRAHYEAEAEPIQFAEPDALLIINKDCPFSAQAYEEFGNGRRVWHYSAKTKANFYAEDIEALRPFGYSFTLRNEAGDSADVTLRIFGRHNVSNAVAAAAIAAFYGVSLEDAAEQLNMFRPRYNRSEVEEVDGFFLVKDYYNAIPAAVISALHSLDDLDISGRRFAVLSDMMELGDHERQFHEEVAEAAVSANLNRLYTIGERGKIISDHARSLGMDAQHFEDFESLAGELKQELRRGDLLLIKGSRSMKLERLYDMLKPSVAVT